MEGCPLQKPNQSSLAQDPEGTLGRQAHWLPHPCVHQLHTGHWPLAMHPLQPPGPVCPPKGRQPPPESQEACGVTQAWSKPDLAAGQPCGLGRGIWPQASVSPSVKWGESPRLPGCCGSVKHPAHSWCPDWALPPHPAVLGILAPAPSPPPFRLPPPPPRLINP